MKSVAEEENCILFTTISLCEKTNNTHNMSAFILEPSYTQQPRKRILLVDGQINMTASDRDLRYIV